MIMNDQTEDAAAFDRTMTLLRLLPMCNLQSTQPIDTTLLPKRLALIDTLKPTIEKVRHLDRIQGSIYSQITAVCQNSPWADTNYIVPAKKRWKQGVPRAVAGTIVLSSVCLAVTSSIFAAQ